MKLLVYLRETLAELKLVRWPSRKDTVNLTLLVIVISIIVGAYVGGLDFAFTNILKILSTK
jgi:preprotein translocase subunit SecE